MIRLDDRTHRRLWAAWASAVVTSFAVLEAVALLDEDHSPGDPDTLTWGIRYGLSRHPVIWFFAAGFWVWQLLHFLLQTVPWTIEQRDNR